MKQLEQIIARKKTIQQARSDIEQQMLSIIRQFGDEITSPGPRAYHTNEKSEISGAHCYIRTFIVENGAINVIASFDGYERTLPLSNFHTEELAEIMMHMLNTHTRTLQNKIDTIFSEYCRAHSQEPRLAKCIIRHQDDYTYTVQHVNIRFASGHDTPKDTDVFHCCGSLENLKTLAGLDTPTNFILIECLSMS